MALVLSVEHRRQVQGVRRHLRVWSAQATCTAAAQDGIITLGNERQQVHAYLQKERHQSSLREHVVPPGCGGSEVADSMNYAL